MSGTQEKILLYLLAWSSARASDVGQHIWNPQGARKGQGSHDWNRFCRVAGKALRALEAARYVRWQAEGPMVLWRLTRSGEAIAGQLRAASGVTGGDIDGVGFGEQIKPVLFRRNHELR